MTDVARLAGVSPSAVSNWRRRHADFPYAERSLGREWYEADEIARWLATRKIAKNDLRAGEVPGDTYGARFQRNRGIPTVIEQGEPARTSWSGAPNEPPVGDWARRLLPLAMRLRGDGDLGARAEAVLGLLYIRAREPRLWERLTGAPRASTVHELLAEAEVDVGPDDRRVRPFHHLPSMPEADLALVELVRAIESIAFTTWRDIARLGSHLLDEFERVAGRRAGDHLTPAGLTRCMVQLTSPRPNDSVYDPFCKAGELLGAAAVHVGAPDALSLAGQAANEQSWKLTKVHMALHGVDVDLGTRPSLALGEDRHANHRFDVVLANPPFNLKLRGEQGDVDDERWPYGAPPRGRANFAWLQLVLGKLAPGGRAAILMPNSTTNSADAAETRIRARMVTAGVIDCVIALPTQLFSSTEIPVSLWILRAPGGQRPDEILFIDATGLGAKSGRGQRTLTSVDLGKLVRDYFEWRRRPPRETRMTTAGFSRAVPVSQVRERRYLLDPHAYMAPASVEASTSPPLAVLAGLRDELDDLRARSAAIRKRVDERLSTYVERAGPASWTRASLGDVCTVTTGPATIDRTVRQQSGIPFVMPRNIGDNRLAGEFDGVDPRNAARFARYRLQLGDVVCTRIGAAVRAGQVQPRHAGWFVGPGCLRLRPGDQVDPSYLTFHLNSPGALDWLKRHAITGTAIKHLSAKRLAEMPLALPPISMQREISKVLSALDEELAVQDQIGASTRRLRDLWLSRLMSAGQSKG